MSDLRKYISDRKKRDKTFAEGYERGYEQFKVGVLLRQARESAGLTQEELAQRLKTKKTAISRIENHAEDIKLSTLERVAEALGQRLHVQMIKPGKAAASLLKVRKKTGDRRASRKYPVSRDVKGHLYVAEDKSARWR